MYRELYKQFHKSREIIRNMYVGCSSIIYNYFPQKLIRLGDLVKVYFLSISTTGTYHVLRNSVTTYSTYPSLRYIKEGRSKPLCKLNYKRNGRGIERLFLKTIFSFIN